MDYTYAYRIAHKAHSDRAAMQGFAPLTLQQFSRIANRIERNWI